MPFTVIRGTYHVKGYSPDGDSIRFQADDSALLQDLPGRVEINPRNHVQLRIEAIDSLETHFTPPSGGGVYHQPLTFAEEARAALLDFVDIKNVEWDRSRKAVISADDGTRGYILTRAVEKYGRPISFVYAGDPREQDGASVHLDSDLLKKSYNYFALLEGLAYATYYKGLFSDLRTTLTDAVSEARAANRRIYSNDATNSGINATSLRTITEQHGIMPKLFRRLLEYLVNYDNAIGFKQKLAQAAEPVMEIATANFTHFDTFIDQPQGTAQIKMTCKPEELVFDEMTHRPPAHTFSGLMGNEVDSPI